MGRMLHGCWVGLAELPAIAPHLTVRRLERLDRVGLVHARIPKVATQA